MVKDNKIKKENKKKLALQSLESIKVPSSKTAERLALNLCDRMEKEYSDKHSLNAKNILKLVGAGVLSMMEFYPSNIYKYASPYLRDPEADIVWERFNISYLKRKLERLEKQKLVEIEEKDGRQIVKLSEKGRVKILKYAIEDMVVKKPTMWNGKWWLVSYDLPEQMACFRNIIRKYLTSWGFYPIHKSVYLHAYPCQEEVTFLREYFGVGKYMKVFKVEGIENDKEFRNFFGV